MDIGTLIGIIVGFVLIVSTIIMGGAASFFLKPDAILIVLGGTFAATLVNFPMKKVLGVFNVIKRAFQQDLQELPETINQLVKLSTKARVDGLLALEKDVPEIQDEFLRKGLQHLVDGTDPDIVKNILATEIINLEERHTIGQSILKTMGTFAPAFGMLGTVMGLIAMLTKLNDPSKIGTGMAVALVTTFYGVFLANLVFLPIAGKLKSRSEQEVVQMELIIQGLSSIQAGDNPRVLQEKLATFLEPNLRAIVLKDEKEGEPRAQAA